MLRSLQASRFVSNALNSSVRSSSIARVAQSARSITIPPEGVTLRYFDSRGRAQSLRYALKDAGVDFKDDKVSIQNMISGNWFNMKNQPHVSGPFGMLPVLDWGTLRIGQTEAIAGYLYHQLGHGEGGGPERAAISASLVSLAHQDLIVVCLQLVSIMGSMPNAPDEQLSQTVQSCQVRINGILPRLETMLATAGSDYFLGANPVMGDYYVMEALDVVEVVFVENLLDNYPALKAFKHRMAARPKMADYITSGERPTTLTGSPSEAAVLQKIRSMPKL
mmetsp:Transcript_69779/g.105449  ORF Transcript_69779/g.105449 Transcript_69779/m.105449 type:complete len:278 (-) Transcript_69779:361-1194(-)